MLSHRLLTNFYHTIDARTAKKVQTFSITPEKRLGFQESTARVRVISLTSWRLCLSSSPSNELVELGLAFSSPSRGDQSLALAHSCAILCFALLAIPSQADSLQQIRQRSLLRWGRDAEGGAPLCTMMRLRPTA